MTARFVKFTDPALIYIQWADLPLAAAWIDELARLTSDATITALQTRPYAEQLAGTRAAWASASNVYRALNVPALSDPAYQHLLANEIGRRYGRLQWATDAQLRQRVGPLNGQSGGTLTGRARILWSRLRATDATPLRFCDAILRFGLSSPDSRVVERCTEEGRGPSQLLPSDCGFMGLWTGCAQQGALAEGCTPWTWDSWAWYAPPNIHTGGGDTVNCDVVRILPPLRWSMTFARDLSDRLTERGAVGTLAASRAFVVVKNLDNASRLRDAAGQPVLPSELERLAMSLPEDVAIASRSNPLFAVAATQIATWGGIAAAGVTVANPIIGAVVGAAVGLASAITGLLGMIPHPVDSEVDEFGRAVPVFELAQIDPNFTTGPSDTNIPEPPGFVRSAKLDLPWLRGLVIAAQNPGSIPPAETPPPAASGITPTGAVAGALLVAVAWWLLT